MMSGDDEVNKLSRGRLAPFIHPPARESCILWECTIRTSIDMRDGSEILYMGPIHP